MHPLNQDSAGVWGERSIDEIRGALRRRAVVGMKSAAGGLRGRNGRGKAGGGYERVGVGREVV
jgi:hypothetical protein